MNDRTKISYSDMPLTMALLDDMCQAIDGELEKHNSQERCLAIYEIIGKRRHVRSHDKKSFLAYGLPEDLGSIFLRLQTPHRRIMVKISTSKNDSYVTVEGSEAEWVRSTASILEKIVEKHKALAHADRLLLSKARIIMWRLSVGGLVGVLLRGIAE